MLGLVSACSSGEGPEAVGSLPLLGPGLDPPAVVDPAEAVPGERRMDDNALRVALARSGIVLGRGSGVYAARLVETDGALAYREFQAGAGAAWPDFWPASSIKIFAALGALRYVGRMGFTGAATVKFADGFEDQVRHVYDRALRESDNEAYDRLLQIAGVDWLNTQFLTAANGFPTTVVQRPYSGVNVRVSPAMTFTEGATTVRVAARRARASYKCRGTNHGNCSTLRELSASVRRVVLDVELPEDERLGLDASDRAALSRALLRADGFFEEGVARSLGPVAQVFGKYGWVKGRSCVDVAMIEDGLQGQRYVLAVVTPDDGGDCTLLTRVAEKTAAFLRTVDPAA